jgi:hypothetical protein
MQPMKFILFSFFFILCVTIDASAKAWRSIVPLHSTRADVERLLGKPTNGMSYDLEDERVEIFYVEKPCESTGPLPGFNVPTGTVSQIIVSYKKQKRKSDLNLDESRFSKTKESDTDWQYYSSHEEGVLYTIYEPEGETNGIVGQTIYFASTGDEHLRCPQKPKRRSSRKRRLTTH